MRTVTVQAIQVNSSTYKVQIREQEATLSEKNNRQHISFKPGVTGHESFYVTDWFIGNTMLNGLYLCAGTPGKWHSLFLHKWNVHRMWIQLGYTNETIRKCIEAYKAELTNAEEERT
jgi:hypothetical protein